MTEPAREQSRARYPDSSGYIKRDGVRAVLRGLRLRRADRLSACRRGRSSIRRHWKMQIPYLARHCRVVTFDGARQRPLRPPGGGIRGGRVRRRCPGGDGRHRDRAGGDRLALGRRAARPHPGGRAPGPGGRGGLHLPGRAVRLAAGGPHALPVGRSAAHRRGLGQRQPLLLAAGLPRLPGVLLLPDVHRAALDQADRRLHRLGPGDHRRDAHRDGNRCRPGRGDRARAVRPGSLPGAGHPGHGGRDHRARPRDRARRGDRRQSRAARGLGPRPARA